MTGSVQWRWKLQGLTIVDLANESGDYRFGDKQLLVKTD
jgi:hypothetical protein